MITVSVKFFAVLREITKKKEVEIKLGKKEPTILEILERLSEMFGEEFGEYVFESPNHKSLRSQLSVMVNGQSISSLKDLNTLVKNGDTIAILPPISGG